MSRYGTRVWHFFGTSPSQRGRAAALMRFAHQKLHVKNRCVFERTLRTQGSVVDASGPARPRIEGCAMCADRGLVVDWSQL